MSKWTSRKFLLCVAAFLGSIGASIAALQTDNSRIAALGIVCATISAAIYAAAEASVDAKAVNKATDLEDFLDGLEFTDSEEDEEDLEDLEDFEEDEDDLEEEDAETRANIEAKEAY